MKHKAFKFRIYPNKKQRELIHQTTGCCRFVYNHFLTLRTTAYRDNGVSLSFKECAKMTTKMRKQDDTAWFRNVDSTALQSSLRNLDDAFSRFF